MIEPNTPEWEAARLGKLTASRFWEAVKTTKTGWSEYRRKYAIELLAERLSGMRAQRFLSDAMLWGVETEAAAIRAYEKSEGVSVAPCGFIDHPKIAMSGATPDGFVGDDGLVEVKCPETRTHVAMLMSPELNDAHYLQMQWQIACTGRKWCDYLSFDLRMPPALRLARVHIMRDEARIALMEKQARAFLAEVTLAVQALEAGKPYEFDPGSPATGSRAEHLGSDEIAASLSKPTPLVRPR